MKRALIITLQSLGFVALCIGAVLLYSYLLPALYIILAVAAVISALFWCAGRIAKMRGDPRWRDWNWP